MKLKTPCSYQGGKSRLAKKIVSIFFEENIIDENTKFYDFCCGSGAITLELISRGISPKNIIMLDLGSWSKFWGGIGTGDFDLNKFKEYIDNIPEDRSLIKEYMKDLSKKPVVDEEYIYLLLQASAFGGKQLWVSDGEWQNTYFRSYWKPTKTSKRRSPVNPMMPLPETLYDRVTKLVDNCKGITCFNEDIMSFDFNKLTDNFILYIDPPYKNTTSYGFDFDTNDLIKKLNNIEKKGSIYISEGVKLSEHAELLSGGRSKGGISGSRSKANEEWLSKIGV